MRINVRLATASTLALGLAVVALAADAPAPATIDLWPAAPPGDSAPIEVRGSVNAAGGALIAAVFTSVNVGVFECGSKIPNGLKADCIAAEI